MAKKAKDKKVDVPEEHIAGGGEESSPKPVAVPKQTVGDNMVLRVKSYEGHSRCQLDIVAAIKAEGGKATVAKVIEIVTVTHKAPRSLIAANEKTKPGFVRGYVTHMVRSDYLSANTK